MRPHGLPASQSRTGGRAGPQLGDQLQGVGVGGGGWGVGGGGWWGG